jgi:hypothetical protein
MKDVGRLRRTLYAALVGAAACGGGGAAGGGAGGGPAVKLPPDAGAAYVDDGRTGVLKTPPGNCTEGEWCGPAAVPKKFTAGAGVPEKLGCPEAVVDGDGTSLTLQEDKTTGAREAGQSGACCYSFVARCYQDRWIEGRPLTGASGEARVAAARRGRWGAALPGAAAHVSPALAARLAAGWREDALAEHASVASFARATLELMGVGAPGDLLAAVQRAALDEVRHAERSFALAARYGAVDAAPGPLVAPPPRGGGLVRLAVDTFVEGCVGETIAALAARRALAGCRDEVVARVLRGIARDEARHAALAWRTVAWCVGEGGGGDEVRAAIARAAADAAPRALEPGAAGAREPGARAPELAAHGRLDEAERAAAARDAWRGAVEPLVAELCRGVPPLAVAGTAPIWDT